MVVRPAEREDRSQLLELIKGYFAFYRTPFPAVSKIATMLDLLERDPGLGVQLVAEEAGRLHGFASLYACLDTLVAERILVMNDLFVDPSLRNRGVGAALFDASLAYATVHGYARLDWVTAADNQGAQRFYDRHGGRRGPWVSYSATPSDHPDR
ncbi:MAG TPA: GNAT family N-acetyltransferase [Candidatus Dormibacteraeota bacterium]|nr:GNAT family N-acetyltransferase [Candidatus Dormibacteraeota bacterium]